MLQNNKFLRRLYDAFTDVWDSTNHVLKTSATLALESLEIGAVESLSGERGMILHRYQLDTNGTNGAILSAMAFSMLEIPQINDTFILKRTTGAVLQTFTFKAAHTVDFDVKIEGTVAATVTNLIAEIIAKSLVWRAGPAPGLQSYFTTPFVAGGAFVVYSIAWGANVDSSRSDRYHSCEKRSVRQFKSSNSGSPGTAWLCVQRTLSNCTTSFHITDGSKGRGSADELPTVYSNSSLYSDVK
jgi:hypothetical protein